MLELLFPDFTIEAALVVCVLFENLRYMDTESLIFNIVLTVDTV